jgi:hypothetical protein
MTESAPRQHSKSRGYEDQDVLLILTQVLLEKPELTITAAIKSLGIVDQASIRRLREKHQAAVRLRQAAATSSENGLVIKFPTSAAAEPVVSETVQSKSKTRAATVPPHALTFDASTKPAAATSDSADVRKRIRDDMAAANMPSAPFGAAVLLPDAFYETGGAGMKAWLSALEMQQVMWFEMMRTLPMAAALRNQMMFCEWTMAAYRRAPKSLKD